MLNKTSANRRVLLTGATGYVGGRLLRALQMNDVALRCMARNTKALEGRVPGDIQLVQADVLDRASSARALAGVDTAYYLIHSMGSTGDFEDEDRKAATIFTEEAAHAGVRRIIYLGGLGSGSDLSPHLASRQDVGRVLASTGVTTVELRASVVIGSGSLSFEMVRSLVEKLPVMITPSWVRSLSQPIAIEDLVDYLVAALDAEVEGHRVVEIGGADQVSYGDIMNEYARQRGLRRVMIPVPVLSPRLSSRWLGLVTPVYARIGRKLLDSVRNPTVVTDDSAKRVFPDITPLGITAAIERALHLEDRDIAETRWSDALSSKGASKSWAGVTFRRRIVDSRTVDVPCPPDEAFAPIRRIGGNVGWYYGTWLWHVRGFLDLLVGGVGVRRGRRDSEHVHAGDALDFWRVEAVTPNAHVRLQAEMKLPGRAWLEFEVEPTPDGSRIRQTAIFDPVGLFGLAYWYALYPLHRLVFAGMLRGIARSAVDTAAEPAPAATAV